MAQSTDWDKGVISPPSNASAPAGPDWDSGTLTPPPPKRSLWAAVNDNVIEGANAAAGTVSAGMNFFRPGNAASQWIVKNIVEAGEAAQSDVVKAEKARYRQEMQDADGMVGEVGATLGYVARNPLLAAAQAAGSFVVPGGAIKGATTGARALGLGAKGTTRAGLAAGAGVGAAGAGGDAAGTAYELSREGGATDEQAVAAARGASVLPAAIGAAGGLVGAERLVAGARGFKGGRVARALKTGAVESAPEALEEGVTQYEGRRAAVPFNPDLDPMKGVAGAATMGGVLGAATGAGTSLLTGNPHAQARKPSEDLGLDPSNGPLSKVAAAAVDEGRSAAPMQPAQPEGGLSLQPVEQPEAPATPSMAERLEALPQQDRAQANQLLREIADERTPEGVKRFRANELQQLLDANPMPQVPSMDISQEDRIAMVPIVRGFDPSTGQAPGRPLELVDAQPQYEGGIDFEQQPQAEPSSLIQLAEWYERSAQGNRDAANPVDQVQQQVRQGTQYTDAAQVQAARQAVEDAWLSLNAGESVSQAQADGGPGVEAAPADLTTETNARLRAGRVASGVRNAFDGGAPNTLRVIQHVNQGLRTIGEPTLTSPEIARIRRLADARTAFAGLNQRADLPADPAPAVDANADNSAMEALIPERPALQPAMEQGAPGGAADPAQRAVAGNADIAGDRVGGDWVAFGPSSGTLGVPRAQMPQVDAAHRGALVNYLKGQGIASEQAEVPANSLKPTQAEFSEAKVRKASKRTGGDRAILVSSDGYVVDGHHQWLAKRQDGQPVKVLQLQAPISQLLPLVGDFPSARTAEGAQATSQGQPSNGSATPLNDESQAAAPDAPQVQTPGSAVPQQEGVADATQTIQAQQTGAQPQAQGAAPAEGAGQAAPAQATPAERKRTAGDNARSRSYAANPMRAFLAKHGVNLDTRSEFAPGLQEIRGTLVPGYGPMFRKSGKPLDTLVQNAVEEGFLPEGATEADLYDLIDRAVRQGERVAPMYTESAAESEFEAMAARQAEFAREDYEADRAAQDAEAAEYDAVLAQEFVGLNDEQLAELDASAPDLDAGSNTTTEAAMRALGFSEKEIQDAVAREQGVAPEARQRGSEAVQADTRGAQARTGASQGDALQSYTEAELKQRQEAQEKAEAEAAKAEREAAAKEKAERERKEISARQAASAENFELGQDPMASLSGQTSIFDAPPQPVVQAAPAQPQQAQDAAEINAEARQGNAAMFSRTERPVASKTTAVQMRRAMVQRTVGGLTQGWGQSPRITVVDSMNDPRVPEAVREADRAQRSQGATGEPEGFWYQGQVYLVASALPTSADATRVLYHEVLGHHGLRGRFGAELDKVLDQVAKLRPKDVAAKASEYGLDMGNPDHVAYAAEEVLAELAQTRPDLGFVQRAIAAIRNFLRSHVPGFKALELTDADIVQGYLLPARGWVERSGLLDAQEEAASSMEPTGQAFSRAPSVESAAFKRWYGDWQNAAQGVPNNDSINLDTRGERALNAVQREGSVGAYPDGATRVGDFTFPGASGPVGRDGAPARLFHGTRDDITAFDRGAASRKDNGWLGAGFYFTSEPFIADLYSGAKQGAVGRNTMPVYVAVRNPYVASHAEKAEMKHWTRERLEQHTQALIEQGYDGVVLEGDGGVIELVAFEPTQVKSAIGNNGNYDPANPDIRYSRSQPADAIRSSMGSLTADQERKASWAAPSASQWDDLTYKLQDKHIDTKRVLDSIRATGKAIGDDLDVYLQEELYHGRAAKRTEDFVAQELEPLVRYMSGAGLKMPELEEFLHARHAKEANAVIARRNPDLPDGGSGMTNAEADAVMAGYSPTKRSLLGKAAEKVDAIIAQTRQTFVEYGLESQDTVDAWGQTFAHYVPLMREQEGDGMAGLGTGQGFSVKGKEVKGRTGSTKKVVDILANIAMQRERAIVRGEKNRVAAALVGLAKANPSGFWKVDVVPTRQVLGKDGMVKTEHDPLYKQRDNVVVAKIPEVDAKTGKVVVKEHAVLFDENDARALRMAQSLKNLDAAQLEGMLGATAKVTRYLAAINTQYNPIFGVTNLARDLQGAAINLQSTELAGRHGEVLAQSLPALRGIYSEMRAQRKGETTGTPWSQLWEEFQGVGGQTGYRDQFRTSADRGEAIEKALDPGSWADSGLGKLFTANGALKVPMEFARKKAQWLFQWLEDYNTAMENGVRLATYKAGLDAGLSKERAASIAKNLTTNFNRKGQVAQQVGALYAFFNASMQGTARIGQAIFTMEPGKPKTMRLSPFGKKVVFGGVTLGVMQALLLAAAGFDEGEPQEFVRERNLIIPVGGKKYITIPMPLGLHVLPNLGRIPAEFAMGGFQNPSATAIKVMSLFADAFNPMGSAGLSMQTLVPTVLDPLAALAENKDFSGRSIAKESFNQATPGHALGRDSASALATWVAQAINFLSGGTQYVRGEFSPTPDQIEYLVGQATGGVGRELLKLQSTAKGLMDGDEVPPHKVPLLGRFYGDSDTPSAKQATFYGHMDSVRRHAEQVKGLRLDGNASEALAYAASHPEARLAFAARKASQDVQKMRERRRELELQGASKEAIRDMDQRMVRRMELFNELVGRTVGAS